MLEAVFADILHQLLQVVHLCHGDAAVHAVGVVRQLTLAQIRLDAALRVVGRDAEEREGTLADLCIYRSEGVDLAECASEYAERAELQVVVAHERLRVVAAVRANTLVAVLRAKSVSQAAGISLSLSIDIVTHGAQP